MAFEQDRRGNAPSVPLPPAAGVVSQGGSSSTAAVLFPAGQAGQGRTGEADAPSDARTVTAAVLALWVTAARATWLPASCARPSIQGLSGSKASPQARAGRPLSDYAVLGFRSAAQGLHGGCLVQICPQEGSLDAGGLHLERRPAPGHGSAGLGGGPKAHKADHARRAAVPCKAAAALPAARRAVSVQLAAQAAAALLSGSAAQSSPAVQQPLLAAASAAGTLSRHGPSPGSRCGAHVLAGEVVQGDQLGQEALERAVQVLQGAPADAGLAL